mgnify:CR=1 FL=1
MVNIIEISNLNLPELAVYAELSEGQLLNRHEPEKGLFIAESPKVVLRALDAGYEPVSLLVENRLLTAEDETGEILQKCGDIPVYTAEFDVLTQITGFKLTRGMLCAMRRPALRHAEDLLQSTSCVAVLEDVMNPTNLGAIFRSAAALGVEAVLLTESCTDPLYRRCLRVSMGNVFFVPWAYLPDDHWQALLHENGFGSVAMALREDAKVLWDPALREIKKIAVVMGSEGPGLKASTIASCDYTVTVPMTNGVDSLNVAAASAVAFYQLALLRQHPL